MNSSEIALRGLSWLLSLGFIAFVLVALDELGLVARWAMAVLFVLNDFTHYLSQELRPYALAGEVLRVIADLAQSGQTMVVVTHDMQFARRVAHTVHVMERGRIELSGTPGELFEKMNVGER